MVVALVNEGMFPLEVNEEMLSYEKGPALHTHGNMRNSTSTERFLGERWSGVFLFCSLFVHYQKSMGLYSDFWFPYGSCDY